MNIEKLREKILQLSDGVQTVLFLAAMACVTTIVSIVIVQALMFFDRSHCLDSPQPRRYSGKCEEYHDGKWGEPLKDNIYFYNGAGSRITE